MSVELEEQLIVYATWLCDESDHLASTHLPRRPEGSRSTTRRAVWLAIAAVLTLIAGVAVWRTGRDHDRRIQPAGPPSVSSMTPSDRTVDPLPSAEQPAFDPAKYDPEAHDPAFETTEAATPSALPAETASTTAQLAFTPLVLRQAPPGYTLQWARYSPRPDGGPPNLGIVRYTSPGQPALEVIIRGNPGFFDRARQETPETWMVGDRLVINDSEGFRCQPDYCSVGVQWDDLAAVSVTWHAEDGQRLDAAHDLDSLIPYVGDLVEDREAFHLGQFDEDSPYFSVSGDPTGLPRLALALDATFSWQVVGMDPAIPDSVSFGYADSERALWLPDGRMLLSAHDGSPPKVVTGVSSGPLIPATALWESSDLGGPVHIHDVAVIDGVTTLLVERDGGLAVTPLDHWQPRALGVTGKFDRASLSDSGLVVARTSAADQDLVVLASATISSPPDPSMFGLDPARAPRHIAATSDGSILAWTTPTSVVFAAVADPTQRLELPLPAGVTRLNQFDVEGTRTQGTWTGLAALATDAGIWIADLSKATITEWVAARQTYSGATITLSPSS